MKDKKWLNSFLQSALLTGSALMLAGCHNSGPAATPEVALPVIQQSVIPAEILDDGSILIPADTIVKHIGTAGVFILSDDNQARFRMVKAGKNNGDLVSISSGLTGNEQILTGPYESIYDGSPVKLTKE
ncbi:MAG: hypothetical protein WBN49_02265 [Arenicellales bacterium]